MIPDSSSAARGPKKSSTAPKLSAQDFETISQAFKELNELGINSFTSLEAYIDWYRNVFGQLALEMLLEDCRKALREKDYKKLLAIMSAMAITHRAHTGSIISIDEPKAIEPIEVEQLLMEYEMYFDELEIEEIVLEEKERSLDEGGYISFSEISRCHKWYLLCPHLQPHGLLYHRFAPRFRGRWYRNGPQYCSGYRTDWDKKNLAFRK